ncbi:MAG TPA: DUF4365 domain-containing protein, partial [Nannocystis sp.]
HSPVLGVQLKSTALDLPADSTGFPYDLKVKNYNDLIRARLIPCVLVVFVLPEDPAHWLSWSETDLVLRRSAYWLSLCGRPPSSNEATTRIHLSRARVFDGEAIRGLLERISRREAIPHV